MLQRTSFGSGCQRHTLDCESSVELLLRCTSCSRAAYLFESFKAHARAHQVLDLGGADCGQIVYAASPARPAQWPLFSDWHMQTLRQQNAQQVKMGRMRYLGTPDGGSIRMHTVQTCCDGREAVRAQPLAQAKVKDG